MDTFTKEFVEKVADLVSTDPKFAIVQNFEFRGDLENEFIFFFKPESFHSHSSAGRNALFEMVFSKLEEHGCVVSGAAYLAGDKVREMEVMDKHYGYINSLSKSASSMLSKSERESLAQALEIEDMKSFDVMGGHEFMQKYPTFTPESLDEFWQTKKSIKIRSGLYVQKYEHDGKHFIIVNGFHPLQLDHFTNPDSRLLVMLLHSNQDWKALKDDLAGDTFPERANKGSIRSEILLNRENYQVGDVSISNNYVHLSAGPFEALYEIQNFLSGILSGEFSLERASMTKKLMEAQYSLDDVRYLLTNPEIQVDSAKTNLFTSTENTNTSKAIELSKQLIKK